MVLLFSPYLKSVSVAPLDTPDAFAILVKLKFEVPDKAENDTDLNTMPYIRFHFL